MYVFIYVYVQEKKKWIVYLGRYKVDQPTRELMLGKKRKREIDTTIPTTPTDF